MVVTRNSQQSSSSQSVAPVQPRARRPIIGMSDSESDDEPLDVKKRKRSAARGPGSTMSLVLTPLSNKNRKGGDGTPVTPVANGHSYEEAHNSQKSRETRHGQRQRGTADGGLGMVTPSKPTSSSQLSTRTRSQIQNKINYNEATDREDETFDDNSSVGSGENGDFDPELNSTHEESQDSQDSHQDDDEGTDWIGNGHRRSKRQIEKRNVSWVAMEQPSARGYPTRSRTSTTPKNGNAAGPRNRNEDEEENGGGDESSQDLYTRIKKSRRPRPSFSTDNGETSGYTHSPRKGEPISRRLRARNNPKVYNVQEAWKRILSSNRRSGQRRDLDDSDGSSGEEEAPRKRPKKALLLNNDGCSQQQLAGGVEGFEPIKPDTSINFSSVGGLDDFIQKIREVILFPMLYKPFYENRRITPPRGLLLYGPPGTGKTLLARAVAGEATKINGKPVSFFMLKGSEVQTKWVGESEKALRELFKTATARQPSIIFFDEFDGLAAHRSIKTDQFHNSLVSTFLAELDGLRDRGQIIVIGATNRVEAIDPAFRRAGRLDFELQFRLPDYNARREIVKIHTKDWPDAPAGREMEELASLTAGYNGADLKLICSQACLNALKRRYPQIYKRKEKLAIDYESVKVSHVDFVQALEVVPRSSFRSTLAMTALPLPELLKPLLQRSVDELKTKIDYIFQVKNPGLISPSRKRILIFGDSQYIVPAALYTMDTLSVSAISTQSITLSESESRAILAAFSEASVKRGILYIQDIDKVYKMLNPLGRLVLHQELSKVDDVSLVLATSTDPVFPLELDEFFENCHFDLLKTTSDERHEFFQKIFTEEVCRVRIEIPPSEEEELEVAEADSLSQDEMTSIEKREERKLRGLRIFLREMLQKLARNKKFYEFTTAVDTNEVPDYLDVIANPMDFEKIMDKINHGEYLSAKMFLDDIDLIVSNCFEYNDPRTPIGKQIRLKARSLKDEAEELIDRELNSDFEEECQQIAAEREERKRRTEESQHSRADGRKKTPVVTQRRKRSRDNNRDAFVVQDNNEDLGFRKVPNAEKYRKALEQHLRKIVRATENSTLLELTTLRFNLSCACQQYYDSEDKDLLVEEIGVIASSAEHKKTPSPEGVPSSSFSNAPARKIHSKITRYDGSAESEFDDLTSNSIDTNSSGCVRPGRRTNGHCLV